jgi:hypothetical protein
MITEGRIYDNEPMVLPSAIKKYRSVILISTREGNPTYFWNGSKATGLGNTDQKAITNIQFSDGATDFVVVKIYDSTSSNPQNTKQ